METGLCESRGIKDLNLRDYVRIVESYEKKNKPDMYFMTGKIHICLQQDRVVLRDLIVKPKIYSAAGLPQSDGSLNEDENDETV